VYSLASIQTLDNELPEKITWGKYMDRCCDVTHAI